MSKSYSDSYSIGKKKQQRPPLNRRHTPPALSKSTTTYYVSNHYLLDGRRKPGLYTGSLDTTVNLPHGQGVMHYQDGRVYDGHWFYGDKSGFGKLQCSHTKATFQGNFLSNVKNGLFVVNFEDGRQYDGHFQMNVMGKGTMRFFDKKSNDRATYFGYFDGQGQPHGRGKLLWNDNSHEYDGEFVHGVIEGHGRMTYNKHADDFTYYLGAFLNGKRHGMGVLVVNESIEYEGRWYNDQPYDHDDLSDSSSSYCAPKEEMDTGFCGHRLIGSIPKKLSPCSRYTNRLRTRRMRRAQ